MPPTVRTVESTILKPDGTPWADGRVIFTLVPGSFTTADQFPSKMVTAHADADGALSVDLWCNGDGEQDSVYDCQLPSGESFQFVLSSSVSDPVELTVLRQLGVTPVVPQYSALYDIILNQFQGPWSAFQAYTKGQIVTHNGSAFINTNPGQSSSPPEDGGNWSLLVAKGDPGLGGSVDWGDITGTPTTIAGYGIVDAFTQAAADGLYSPLAHTHTFASLTGKPTTIAGYGIADAYTKTEADARYAALVHTHSAADLTSGTLPDARFPATLPALSGINLTALNASNIGSGTLADARLSANIPLLNAANAWTNTGTHAFSGLIRVQTALGTKAINLADSGASNAVRGAHSIVTSTSDWVFYKATGTAGSETYAEAIRVENATAYVQIAQRLGIKTTPGFEFHVVGDSALRGHVGVNANPQSGVAYLYVLSQVASEPAAIFLNSQATATAPIMKITHGATPGAGGFGLDILKSDGTTHVFFTTDKFSVVVGSAALGTTATDGFLYIPTCAGAPTGVPTVLTGRIPMIYDTTNNFFYFYTGGWKKSTVYA